MIRTFRAVVLRDLLVRARKPGEVFLPLLFLVTVVALFPLAIGPSIETLRLVAPGIVWIATVLSALLSLDLLFRADFEDGTLEQLALSRVPLSWVILAKLFVQWLCTAMPAIAIAPLLALWVGFPAHAVPELMLSLLVGTPALIVTGAVGSALTLGMDRGGTLLALLVLPLFVPVLIFGAGTADAAATGLPVQGPIRLLSAGSILALTLGPVAISAALRISLD